MIPIRLSKLHKVPELIHCRPVFKPRTISSIIRTLNVCIILLFMVTVGTWFYSFLANTRILNLSNAKLLSQNFKSKQHYEKCWRPTYLKMKASVTASFPLCSCVFHFHLSCCINISSFLAKTQPREMKASQEKEYKNKI